MVILLRSTDGNPDSRLEKYVKILCDNSLLYRALCWDRLDKYSDNNKFIYYKGRALYGSGYKNIMSLVKFNIFLFKYLFKNRKKFAVIHACDFDTILPAILMKILFKKKVIYDIFDWYVDSREISNSLIKIIILFFEFINIKCSDVTILCEEERKDQIKFKPSNLWILPNIPHFQYIPEEKIEKRAQMRVVYVGVLTKHRGIEKALKAISSMKDVELHIAGFGEFENKVCEYATNYPNIIYYGSVAYENGIALMASCDVILALYEKTIPNHIYAAPNKYYEGLFLGKPIITTQGTFVGKKTEKFHTGFVIGEEQDDIEKLLSMENLKAEIELLGINARNRWESKYKNYIYDFMQKKYLSFMKK